MPRAGVKPSAKQKGESGIARYKIKRSCILKNTFSPWDVLFAFALVPVMLC